MNKLACILVCLFACSGSGGGGGDGGGGDDDGSSGGKLIPTGGVSDAPLVGTIHVYAVESGGATPIANASVHVGTLGGVTDSGGLLTLTDASLTGKVTVTVTASGHAAATWIGVTGSNVTVPLETSPRAIPTAKASGTIAGWNSLPSLSFGHYHLAVILYSFLDDPSAPENSLVQPTVNNAPADTCIDSTGDTACAWSLVTRIGQQIHTAVILDGDSKLTANDASDDTYTLIGYAAGSEMTMTANQNLMGESLAMVPASTQLAFTFPPTTGGLGTTLAIPELQLDSGAGRIVMPLPTVNPGHATDKLIAATGSFAGHYEVVALATPSGTATTPFSTGFVHNASGTATIPSWLVVPTAVTGGTTFMFGGTSPFVTAQVSRTKQPLWDVTILDGSTSFTLPTITPDPIGAGAADFAVTLTDAPSFDPGHFDVGSTTVGLARAAGAQASFTR